MIPIRGRQSAVLLGLIAAAGCSVKSPEVPRTNFAVSIPIADDRTTILEVADERSDYLRIADDGGMQLRFTTDLGEDTRETVGERLQITPQAGSFSTAIGLIPIPGGQVPPVEVGLDDLLGRDVPPGNAPLIPASDIDTRVEVPLEDVEALTVEEGNLSVDVDNGLPVSLQGLALELVDLGNGGALVQRLDLGDVPAGSAASGAFDLAGRSFSGSLAIAVTGQSQQATDVEVRGDETLVLVLGLGDLLVSEATAVIEGQEFGDRQKLAFPDDRIQVTEAAIVEGSLRLRARNGTGVGLELEFSLDEFRLPDGQPNVFVIPRLESGEERVVDFDLAGNRFEPDNPLELSFSYRARTLAPDGTITLSAASVVEVAAETEPLIFDNVRGILNRLEVPVEPVEDEVDFPDGLDNIRLGQAGMEVYLTSAVGFASEVTLDFVGTGLNGRTRTLQVFERIDERGSPEAPVSLVVVPDSDELTDFLNLLPRRIVVTPKVLVGDGQGLESIAQDHWVQVDSVVFRSDARFTITDSTRIEPDPIRREFKDDEARRRIQASLRGADVVTVIENRVPLDVRVRLMVAPRLEDVYTNPILRIPQDGFFEVEAAPVDGSGRVTQVVSSTQQTVISSEELLVFLQEGGVYTGVLVEFDATQGEVEVFGDDFVNVRASTEILMELNKDLVE